MSSGRLAAGASSDGVGAGGGGSVTKGNSTEDSPDMGNVIYNFSFPVGFGLLSLTCLVLVVYLCVRGPRLRRIFRRSSTRGRSDRDKVREKLKTKLLKRFKTHITSRPKEKGYLETITLQSAYDITCPICLDMFHGPPSQSPVCLFSKCGHFYHFRCVWTWLDKHSRCPVCRRNVALNDVDIKLIPLEKILSQGTYLELEGGLLTVSMMKGPLQDGVKRIRLPKAKPRAPSLFTRSRVSNMSTSRSELMANADGFSPFAYDSVVDVIERNDVSDGEDSSDEGESGQDRERATSSESVAMSSETEAPSSYTTPSLHVLSVPQEEPVLGNLGAVGNVSNQEGLIVCHSEHWENLTPTRCPFEPFHFSLDPTSVEVTVEPHSGSVVSTPDSSRFTGRLPPLCLNTPPLEPSTSGSDTVRRSETSSPMCSYEVPSSGIYSYEVPSSGISSYEAPSSGICSYEVPSSGMSTSSVAGLDNNSGVQEPIASITSLHISLSEDVPHDSSGHDLHKEPGCGTSTDQTGSHFSFLYDNLCSDEPSPEGAEVSWHL